MCTTHFKTVIYLFILFIILTTTACKAQQKSSAPISNPSGITTPAPPPKSAPTDTIPPVSETQQTPTPNKPLTYELVEVGREKSFLADKELGERDEILANNLGELMGIVRREMRVGEPAYPLGIMNYKFHFEFIDGSTLTIPEYIASIKVNKDASRIIFYEQMDMASIDGSSAFIRVYDRTGKFLNKFDTEVYYPRVFGEARVPFIKISNQGDIAVLGTVFGVPTLKFYDRDGNLLWDKKFEVEWANTLDISPDGQYIIVSVFEGQNKYKWPEKILLLDRNGEEIDQHEIAYTPYKEEINTKNIDIPTPL